MPCRPMTAARAGPGGANRRYRHTYPSLAVKVWTVSSAKQRLPGHRDPLDGRRVDRHAEARPRQGRRPAAAAESNVLAAQRFADEVAVERPFDGQQVADARREVPPGRGENR